MSTPGAAADPAMDLEVFVTPGLGDNSYLVASGDEAVIVDPQRDAWRFVDAARARGVRIRAVLETHVHNDYVSGAHEIRAATGAELVVPARGRYTFDHRPADDGDEVEIGELRIVARATPGHTPEHLAWEVRPANGGAPDAVLTGGSLLVGSAGRSDLLGPELAESLAREQYRSIQRLATLPDAVRILPTHGAGSFCVSRSAGASSATSTVAAERFANPAVWGADEDAFVREHLSGLLAYPAYYRHMAPLNRAGAPVIGAIPSVAALTADEVADLATDGAWVVDARGRHDFAAAHLPGSVNVELGGSFGGYVGWVVPFGERIVLVLPEPVSASGARAVTQLFRIGYDRVAGSLHGGIDAWLASGRATRSYGTASMGDLYRERLERGTSVAVLDVRQAEEWKTTPAVSDAQRIFLGDLTDRLDEVGRDDEVWVHCATGYRAAVAASLMDRAGIPVRLVASGGGEDWQRLLASTPRPEQGSGSGPIG